MDDPRNSITGAMLAQRQMGLNPASPSFGQPQMPPIAMGIGSPLGSPQAPLGGLGSPSMGGLGAGGSPQMPQMPQFGGLGAGMPSPQRPQASIPPNPYGM